MKNLIKRIKIFGRNISFLFNYELYQHSGTDREHDVQTTEVAMIKKFNDTSVKK